MKVLHFLQSNCFSGAENVVCQIIGMLRDEPRIELVYCSPDGPIREALQERSIFFHPIRDFCKEELIKAIDIEKPDVIHAHDMRASFIASQVCGDIRLISHIHNNCYDNRGLTFKSFAFLFPAIKASHLFYVSSSSYEGYYFHNLFKKKSSVLYNILDVKATIEKMKTDRNEYDFDVVYIGRLSYPKNPLRLMEIFGKCVEIKEDIRIAVVGNGELESEVKTACNQLGIDRNITFVGYMSNPLKLLYDSKVMVMSSRWEGTPMCALESMALGVPIVSTPVDGLKDLVIPGQTGYLSDENEELASSIVRIVENEPLHRTLSDMCIKKSVLFNDINNYRRQILKAYLDV